MATLFRPCRLQVLTRKMSLCLLLTLVLLGAVARVYIDDMHRLGVLDDKVCTTLQGYILGKQRLNLFRNIKLLEDGHLALVEFHQALHFGLDDMYIASYLVVHLLVIDHNLREGVVQRVANNSVYSAHLAHQASGSLTLAYLGKSLVPSLNKREYVLHNVDVLGIGSCRANDNTEVGW